MPSIQRPSDDAGRHPRESSSTDEGETMQPFALNYARPAPESEMTAAYAYDSGMQLNVLAGGGIAARDYALLRELGTTTSTAGSKTHFDD
jgi:putative ATP-grasp target RiPP